jgi:amino acid transporter
MKSIKAFSISSIVSIGIVTLITFIGEFSAPFKNGLAALTGHHWVTKSIIGMIVFVILSIILNFTLKPDNENSAKYIWSTFGVALGSSVVLFLFFTIHALV